jgi:hypothetical protein
MPGPLLGFITVILFITLVLWASSPIRKHRNGSPLPFWPKGLPIIGNLLYAPRSEEHMSIVTGVASMVRVLSHLRKEQRAFTN